MVRKPVVSGNIRSVGYDPQTRRLEVEFHGGEVYSYHDVSEEEHRHLMSAASIGKHFHAHIKHRHSYSKR